jgi:hypothetical protein
MYWKRTSPDDNLIVAESGKPCPMIKEAISFPSAHASFREKAGKRRTFSCSSTILMISSFDIAISPL